MLHINDLVFRYGGRVLFDHATAAFSKGWRVGLVGRNGTGKSTLLKLICNEMSPDNGDIRLAGRVRLGRVAQEAPGGERNLLDTVLAADTERAALLAEEETATDAFRIAEIHERLIEIDAARAPARAARILSGLGFDEAAQARPCGSFSGGWRMRVALAALLFVEPDLLLLDEPTNHLDLEATLWLEDYLASYPGTLLLISHDRDLLNHVPDHILHLENGKLELYAGNYDRFERTRAEKLERIAAQNVKLQAQRKHIQAFVDRFRYKASKARQAQSRLKALAKMQPIVAMAEQEAVPLDFPTPDQLAPPIITLDGASVGYRPGQPVLRGLDLRIDMDDRIALLGANGNGKSTLARLLSGRLQAMDGVMTRSPKLRVGYFAQDQAEELDLNGTPVSHLARLMPTAPELKLRNHLGRFGFSGRQAEVTVGSLSGGEKARLLFALISREAPHLVILDEPTNHLDIDTREALVQSLNAFEGAVILVSHDAHLVELVADRLILVKDGTARPFDGDMDDYRRLLLDQGRQARREAKAEKAEAPAGPSKKEQRKAAAEARAAAEPLRRKVRDAERNLERLTAERAKLEAEMADPALYDGRPDRLVTLQTKHADLAARIAATEEAWLLLQEELEQADA